MTKEKKSFFSGAIAGGVSVLVFYPVDLMKVRAQVNRKFVVRYREEFAKIFKNEGFAGLYKGFGQQKARDIPGRGIYFFTYGYLQ